MKTMSASQFKAECLHLLDVVGQTGQPITILKRGKPVAQVVRVPQNSKRLWLALAGSGRFQGDPLAPSIGEDEIEALR